MLNPMSPREGCEYLGWTGTNSNSNGRSCSMREKEREREKVQTERINNINGKERQLKN